MAEETKKDLMDFLVNAASFGLMKAKNEEEKKDEKEPKAENEDVDKRKLIDEVAGMMKSAGCDDEVIRTAIAKMEKIGYDKSEAKTADNEDEKKEIKEPAKNKCKNEDEEKEEKVEDLKKEVDETAENKKAKNSADDVKNAFYQGGNNTVSSFVSQSERIEAGMKY